MGGCSLTREWGWKRWDSLGTVSNVLLAHVCIYIYIYAHVEGVSPFPCYERPVLPAPTPKPTPVSVLARSVYLLLVNISLRSASQPGYRERERERALHTPTFRGKYQASAGINHWLWLAAWWRCSVSLSLSPSPTSASPPNLCHLHHQHKGEPVGGGRGADRMTGWYMSIWQSITWFRAGGAKEQCVLFWLQEKSEWRSWMLWWYRGSRWWWQSKESVEMK